MTLNKFLEKQNLSMKAFSVSNKTRQKRSSTDPWGNPYKSTNKEKETRRPTARQKVKEGLSKSQAYGASQTTGFKRKKVSEAELRVQR